MDEVTTKEEVEEVLQRELGANNGVTLAAIKSLRSSYGKSRSQSLDYWCLQLRSSWNSGVYGWDGPTAGFVNP